MSLVLFDIDGTLVDVRGAGKRVFAKAIREAFGEERDLKEISFAGATDLGVLAQVGLQGHAEFFAVMTRILDDELRREAPLALPGAVEMIQSLAQRTDVTLGLLTGNAKACAKIKIERAGIPFAFTCGAYGDEHADRNELARRARGDHEEVIVVGDTPIDIAAARAIGARAIAVATGRYSADELREADVVATTLREIAL